MTNSQKNGIFVMSYQVKKQGRLRIKTVGHKNGNSIVVTLSELLYWLDPNIHSYSNYIPQFMKMSMMLIMQCL